MLVIRLSRKGAKKRPFYHINLADRRNPRDGRFVEKIGFFDPLAKGEETRLKLDIARFGHWVSKGAKPSDTVQNLLRQHKDAHQGLSEEAASEFIIVKGADKKVRRVKTKEKPESSASPAEVVAAAPVDEVKAEEKADVPVDEVKAEEKADVPVDEVKAEEKADVPVDEVKAEEKADVPVDEVKAEEKADVPVDEVKAEEKADVPVDEVKAEEKADVPVDEVKAEEKADVSVDEVKAEEKADVPVDEVKAEEKADVPVDEVKAEEKADVPVDEVKAESSAQDVQETPPKVKPEDKNS